MTAGDPVVATWPAVIEGVGRVIYSDQRSRYHECIPCRRASAKPAEGSFAPTAPPISAWSPAQGLGEPCNWPRVWRSRTRAKAQRLHWTNNERFCQNVVAGFSPRSLLKCVHATHQAQASENHVRCGRYWSSWRCPQKRGPGRHSTVSNQLSKKRNLRSVYANR